MLSGPQFSVILPVCHGGDFLRTALDTATAQAFPQDEYEVIVAVSAGDTEAASICSDTARRSRVSLRCVTTAGPNRSDLLNAACAEARGEWLAFADDDCAVPPDWLSRIQEAIRRDPDAALIGGVDDLQDGGSAFDEALDRVLRSKLGAGSVRLPAGNGEAQYFPKLWNMAGPRRVLESAALDASGEQLQIFDPTLAVHEDVELGARIRSRGGRILFAPDVRVRHSRDTTFRSFLRRNFNMARTCRHKGLHATPHRCLAGGLLLVTAVAALSFASPQLRPVAGILIGLYLALLILSGVVGAVASRRPGILLFVPSLTAGLHLSRAIGYLWPRAGNRRSETH